MKNILVITYWSLPDALIQTYTLPYLTIIKKIIGSRSKIILVTLEKDQLILQGEAYVKAKESLMEKGIVWKPFIYKRFGGAAFYLWSTALASLLKIIITNNISAIHCWCTPAGAIGYVLASLTNRRLILDSFEPHAEAMAENGTWEKNGLAFKLLFWLEKKQAQKADDIISATNGMDVYAMEKYKLNREFYVKPACVNLNVFSPAKRKDSTLLKTLGLENKIVCVYAGKFGGIYLDQEVFDFFQVASTYFGLSFRVILLTNHSTQEINEYCIKSNFDPQNVIIKFVPHAHVSAYMGLADFAITPIKPVPSKRYCTPIKDGEYWGLGLPVVITRDISDDSEIIQKHDIGAVLNDLSKVEYLNAVKKIDSLLKDPTLTNRIHDVAIRYRSFTIAEEVYKEVYNY